MVNKKSNKKHIRFQLAPGEALMISKKVGCASNYVSSIVQGRIISESKTAILIQKAAHIIRTSRKNAEKKIDEMLKQEVA